MASTYENNLRLNEMGTGDQSGTWGTVTNTNLELIAEAFSYQTEATFDSDGDKTATIADGVSDKYRGMYIKVTSTTSLSTTRTLNIAPNTASKVIFVENATTGSQSISVSQGSGANVVVPNGSVKVLFLDGAGSGAAVYDGLSNLAISGDLTVEGDDLKMGTNTSGHFLVGDGTNYNPVAASGDVTLANTGAFTIANDAVGADQLASNAVVNASIASGAAIAFSKMADLTINRALTTNSDGDIQVSNVTADEINYLDGVSSNIQTQLNNKGDVTGSSSTTFTNKGGNISQWTNDSGYLTVTSYSQSSTSGYIKFGNGLQMCWARVAINTWTPSWTYPLAFSNAVVSLSKHDERTTSSGDGSNYIYSVSNSAAVFTTSANPGHMRVIAIGY